MKKILTLILLTFYASFTFAQFNQGKIKQKHYYQVIPYQRIKSGHLIISVTINGKMYKFLFDTGATLAISDKLYKELNLKIIKQINGTDASGEKGSVKLIILPEIDIQGITFQNTLGVIFPEEVYELSECFGIDGVIGSNMLKNSVVQFDEQHKQIIITDNIKALSLQTNKSQKMKLSPWLSSPLVTVTLQKGEEKVTHNVLFDTGDGDCIFIVSLDKLNSCVVDTLAESEGALGMGFNMISKKHKHLLLNIPKFIVNGIPFDNIVITTTYGPTRIGNKLLEYGKTTLDYKKKRFYFEPYNNMSIDKHSEMPMTIGFTIQNNKMVIGIIWDKTLESQINFGDEILSINGIDLQSMNFCELFMLEIPDSEEQILELRDINTGAIKKVEIKRLELNKK